MINDYGTQPKLGMPLRDVYVTQPFGVNYLDFYTNMGLSGHNGIDFLAKTGCNCYAMHDGEVIWAGKDGDGGISVQLVSQKNGYGYITIYYHLKKVNVKVGDIVKRGDLIGWCDNTGKYTTGSHLHVGFKFILNGVTLDYNNGYKGAIDFSSFIKHSYDGVEIGAKDYDKSRCYHRYYRGRPKGGYQNELKILAILGKKGIFPTAEKINALVYGGWDLETVINPAMYEVWSQLKKGEYIDDGLRPFC